LQIEAKRQARQVVFRHLLHHAWQGGAAALSGRLQPAWLQPLSEEHCHFHGLGPWFMVHSKWPEFLQMFQEGSAVFSRLEGEWCLRYR
jgi:hypothetical protein